jgi:hypothetical protein
MASLTKDGLRTALINHGMKPRISASKKDLQLLYKEHVASFDLGDFSSEDEEVQDESFSPSRKSPRPSASSKIELIPTTTVVKEDTLDVKALDDDELFSKLLEHGLEVGPIVASTRPFYEKKLIAVLSGSGLTNGDFSDTEELDDDENEQFDKLQLRNRTITEIFSKVDDFGQEPDPEEFDKLVLRNRIITETMSKVEDFGQDDESVLEKRITRSTNSSKVTSPVSPSTGLRQRRDYDQVDGEELEPSPSPRRPIHSYRVSHSNKPISVSESKDDKVELLQVRKARSSCLLTLIKLVLVLAAVGVVSFIVITNLPEEGVTEVDEVQQAVSSAQEAFNSAGPIGGNEDQ